MSLFLGSLSLSLHLGLFPLVLFPWHGRASASYFIFLGNDVNEWELRTYKMYYKFRRKKQRRNGNSENSCLFCYQIIPLVLLFSLVSWFCNSERKREREISVFSSFHSLFFILFYYNINLHRVPVDCFQVTSLDMVYSRRRLSSNGVFSCCKIEKNKRKCKAIGVTG